MPRAWLLAPARARLTRNSREAPHRAAPQPRRRRAWHKRLAAVVERRRGRALAREQPQRRARAECNCPQAAATQLRGAPAGRWMLRRGRRGAAARARIDDGDGAATRCRSRARGWAARAAQLAGALHLRKAAVPRSRVDRPTPMVAGATNAAPASWTCVRSRRVSARVLRLDADEPSARLRHRRDQAELGRRQEGLQRPQPSTSRAAHESRRPGEPAPSEHDACCSWARTDDTVGCKHDRALEGAERGPRRRGGDAASHRRRRRVRGRSAYTAAARADGHQVPRRAARVRCRSRPPAGRRRPRARARSSPAAACAPAAAASGGKKRARRVQSGGREARCRRHDGSAPGGRGALRTASAPADTAELALGKDKLGPKDDFCVKRESKALIAEPSRGAAFDPRLQRARVTWASDLSPSATRARR